MVSQLFHEQQDKTYTDQDLSTLKWALNLLWAEIDYEFKFEKQRSFTNLFLPNAKRELARKLFKVSVLESVPHFQSFQDYCQIACCIVSGMKTR